MKESTLATKIMIGILCAGVLVYLAIYLITGFRDEIATTTVYQYSVDVSVEADAVIAREEQVLTSSGTYVDLVLNEGEKAAAGSAVALIYSDSSALNTRQQIRALEAEIRQLEYALSMGTQPVDSGKLDQQVFNSIVAIRSLSAGGDLSTLEDSVLHLRTMVFQRDYTYGDTGSAEGLAQLIEQKENQAASLRRSLSQVSKTVYAPVSGVFSGQTDGFETVLTPSVLESLTPDQLAEFLARDPQSDSNAVGKLITDSTWYLAALFDGNNEPGLSVGSTYTLSFSHDYYGEIEMKLERIETGDGRTMAVFSGRTALSDATLLRLQQVDIVTDRLTGLRIPRTALRVETSTVTDENGVTREVNTYGVYTVVGTQAEWHEVNVLLTGDTYYLVEPVDEGASGRLRAGDTVILSSSGLYDGKVVR